MSDTASKIEELSFEQALEELESIVRKLEQGEGSLEDAIGAYARGAALKAHCQKKLDEARMKVEKIRVPESGAPSETSAFES